MKTFSKKLKTYAYDAINRSILKKSVLIFILILVLPTLLIYQLIIGFAEEMIQENIINKNIADTENIVKRVDNEISSVVLQLHLIAGNREETNIDLNRMYQRSRQAISQSSILHSIYFVNQESRVQFEAPFVPEHENVSYRYPMFNEIQWTKNYALSNVIDNYNGEDVVSVGIPVQNKDNSFQGALIAEISQEYLSEILKSVSMEEGHFGLLIDSDGVVVASSDESLIGSVISDELPSSIIFQNVSGISSPEYDGERSVVAYQTLRDGWGVVLGLPEAVAFAPVKKLSFVLTLSLLSILFLSFFFIVAGIKNIVYPIIRLTNYAKEYNKAMFYQEDPTPQSLRKDEVGELTETIISVGNSNYEKQKMLEENKRYLNDMIEGIPYGIITINSVGTVTHINKQFEQLVGFQRSEIVGRKLSQLPIKENDEDFMLLKALTSSEPSIECESYIIDANAKRHIVKIGTSRFYNERNEIIGSIAVLQDISHVKLLEARLKQNDKLSLIGQITTGIAHEIKNPLAILSGSAEMLKEEVEEAASTEEIKELSSDIDQVVKRMKKLVNNFLNFAKVKDDQAQPLEVYQVIDEVLHLVRFKMKEMQVDVVRNYESEGSMKGYYDPLIQAFLNIILNAIDAMEKGGTLTISITKEETSIHVILADTGSGIQSSDLEWLFDPFFSTKENGNGLGLTIARDIIRENHGELFVESIEGEGTSIHCVFHL